MIKIKYSNSNLITHLISGIILTLMAVYMISMMYGFEVIISILWLFLGVYTILKYINKVNDGYLRIYNKEFTMYDRKLRTVKYNEIINIKKFAGDIIFNCETNTIKIDTNKIEKKSLIILNSFIDKEFTSEQKLY
ncbi:hypothetical protein [Maribacter sp. R77961]|uniref:hypothetical protein n=1 Tax=Maribacter sp. R77961 TaxID=3093871 RepID=UPI0037C73044